MAEQFCALLSTHLIFVSEENRNQARLLKIGPHTPTSLIRSGIEWRSAGPSRIRQECHIPEDAWVVVNVSNFKPQKNPGDLAAAALAVLEEDPAIHFLFVGDGPLRSAVEIQVQEHPRSDHIHFLGWRRDVQEILAASDCFLLTSWWEGLPRSLVEACAARLPIVAYNVDGVRELLADGQIGFPIEPGGVGSAKDRVLYLKRHPQKAQAMGRRGRERAQKDFDIKDMVRQQEALYQKLWEDVPFKGYIIPGRL